MSAQGPANVSVSTPRIHLEDVLPNCPPAACSFDLGPAPPPGSSRLIVPSDLRTALESVGESTKRLAKLKAVRVTSAARTLSTSELALLVRPVVESSLPKGVTLAGIEPKTSVVVPLHATVGACVLSALPKRPGQFASTALIDFLHDGTLARRVPVLLRLVMSAEAARPDVPRGHVLTLVIERRSATISTQGVALRDAEIGELAQFKVQRTGRVVSARIESDGVAVVVESP